ncbi:ribonuclease H-like domain-containing protein [Polychytrium aggregatum]|uniref:ribonuclease H-like domain-containing protein n=1 Tax=Polychytrium aggregatum TaxID=110093 RepID=UPI0022FEED79|nr:ribonuclease H-like domain-containing protein [Polychytrium aggregatum]KAI9203692.1 ribonuclease H-like domain-containing protein [Polychytrium aggregatum]
MDVTRSNFEATLAVIKQAIDECDFVAIDAEMTGLHSESTQRAHTYDTIQQRYAKYRMSAQDFLMNQYGICTFKWCGETQSYEAKPFNIWLFPQQGTFALERCNKIQISSLEFLANNGFDFNKWIKDGVSFLSHDEEARIRRKLDLKAEREYLEVPQELVEWMSQSMASVSEWLQNSSEKQTSIATESSFHRRLIHQEVLKRFNGFLATEGKVKEVIITRMTAEERTQRQANKNSEAERELDSLIGFRKVIDWLREARKPVIGHNMLLDLCHTYQSFNNNLPESVEDFKTGLMKMFPLVYDTKHIASSEPELTRRIPRTGLGDLVAVAREAPFGLPNVVCAPGFDGYTGPTQRFHEAGYDAYSTGLVFVKMISRVEEYTEGTRIDFELRSLKRLKNCLHMMRSDFACIKLETEEERPDRDHIFRIFNLPTTWRSNDVREACGRIGFEVDNIAWIDSSSAYIVLDPDIVEDAEIKILEAIKSEELEFEIQKYWEYIDAYEGTDGPDKKRAKTEA